MRRILVALFLVLTPLPLPGGSVKLLCHDAVVWSHMQSIRGKGAAGTSTTGTLFVNGNAIPYSVTTSGDSFAVPVQLSDGTTTLWATMDSAGVTVSSDTVRLTLGYRLRPEIEAVAGVSGRTVHLHAAVLENPDSSTIGWHWSEDQKNPAILGVSAPGGTDCDLTVPLGVAAGEYIFHITAACQDGDTTRAAAMVTVRGDTLRAFQMRTDHAQWIDKAVLYGITPYIFVENGKFAHITAKIPELAAFGVTTLWIQPVYATHYGGQGYDVVDYFAVRSDLGTAADLHQLVRTAHANGLRVVLDFVPNHSSLHHPYAVHATANGTASHYYDYYQRVTDSAPYAQHYHSYGGFINYFWDELPNLNYSNPEVRRMIVEAGRYWIEEFDIDGYRVDAVWGVNARNPDFMKTWRLALKRLKPDVCLLAEDKATWASVFDERFDAAYDWAREESWVSHWTWQTSYSTTSNPTIFNSPNSYTRVAALRSALTNAGSGYAANAKIMRFMENNDTFRFLPTHDLARTKMTAAMMFALPGIPLLFNGQETGVTTHPYDAFQIFVQNRTIASLDQYGLVPFYRTLNTVRERFPSLTGSNFEEVLAGSAPTVYAFRRWQDGSHILGVVNLAAAADSITAYIPVDRMHLIPGRMYYLSDQLSNDVVLATPEQMDSLSMSIPGYTTRIYVIDTIRVTSIREPETVAEVPVESSLDQNYPNPFNPVTTVQFSLAAPSFATLAVFDILGREVARPVDGDLAAGVYRIPVDGSHLASGVYLCRLTLGRDMRTFSQTRKMLLVR